MSDKIELPRPFFIPNRQEVTHESDPQGRWTHQFPDMLGNSNQGGGKVPADFAWRSNPKQRQEELTDGNLHPEKK